MNDRESPNDRNGYRSNASAVATASSDDKGDDFPDPDYGNLDLTFDDLDGGAWTASGAGKREEGNKESSIPSSKDKMSQEDEDDEEEEEGYILGTLIVRVVAARDLPPVKMGGPIGKLLAGFQRGPSQRRQQQDGGANPYAMVRFGKTTQRTSQVFGTTNPTWPRGENMFMDVTHPRRRKKLGIAQSSHPGDPPRKKGASEVYKQSSRSSRFLSVLKDEEEEEDEILSPEKPVLTIALFHADNNSMSKKHNPSKPSKLAAAGDSDDSFLGAAEVDLTALLTGKERSVDIWLPLAGGEVSNKNIGNRMSIENSLPSGSVRILCEYESSDTKPRPGDLVRFTGYCHSADLYPFHHHKIYKVMENDDFGGANNGNYWRALDDEDSVTISYESPEGWICSAVVHRFMLICEEQHHGPLEVCHDEFITFGQRLSRSPMVHVLQDSLEKVPDEGLVSLGVATLQGGSALFSRWFREGFSTVVQDIVYATNMNGQNDPSAEESLADADFQECMEEEDGSSRPLTPLSGAVRNTAVGDDAIHLGKPLPNMPCCPITGEPMLDPVVAADGHTYERSAIARWLATSDKSPLTGSVLAHKNLVSNYMLLSSLQDAATSPVPLESAPPPPPPAKPTYIV